MKLSRFYCESRKGFTLVELIAVVAIVAILAALLSTGLSSARAKANDAKCVSNLRQIGAGALAYFQDRNGMLFATKSFYSASYEKDGGMRDYVGINFPEKTANAPTSVFTDTIFSCPMMKEKLSAKFQPALLFNRCYTMNEFAIASEDGIEKSADYPKRIARIPALSAMMLFSDGSATGKGPGNFHTVFNPSYVTRDFLFYPHGGGQNVVFFDGHVEKVPEAKFRAPENPMKFWGNLSLPESSN